MKPSYETLKGRHNSSEFYKAGFLSGEDLYKEIGYSQSDLIKQNKGYVNTCATRLSLALLKSGVSIQGRLKIKAGKLAGSSVEPGAKLLADQLARPGMFGAPTYFRKPAEAPSKLKGQKGVVFFWRLGGSDGGHIDLIETANSTQVCNSNCYFACQEIWFWPLH
jgi:hypothetical protein